MSTILKGVWMRLNNIMLKLYYITRKRCVEFLFSLRHCSHGKCSASDSESCEVMRVNA